MSKYDKLIKENKARRENVQDQQRIIKGGMGEMAADARRTAAILGNAHDELSEIVPRVCPKFCVNTAGQCKIEPK